MHEVHHLANTYTHTHSMKILEHRSCEGVDIVTLTYIALLALLQLELTNYPLKEILFGRIILSSSCGQTLSVMKWPKGVPVTCFFAHIDTHIPRHIRRHHLLSVLYSRSMINILHTESALIMVGKQRLVSGSRGSTPACRSGKTAFMQHENWWPRQQRDIWAAINFQRLDRHRKEETGTHSSCISSSSAQNRSSGCCSR